MTTGPLRGMRIVELAGLGPAPFAAMMLSDMGADVVRVDRVDRVISPPAERPKDVVLRGRRSLALNLKAPDGVAVFLRLVASADAVLECYRPGVAERLGIGPNPCAEVNPGIVYGRVTGWGQDGPLAAAAGHDINYTGLAGALHAIGERGGPPTVPLNLVADYGGGAMVLVAGLLAAFVERSRTGKGQVVDAAMVDGVAALMSQFVGLRARGEWVEERGRNRLDGGASYYRVYECSDGRHIAVGALERKFYVNLMRAVGLEPRAEDVRTTPDGWAAEAAELAEVFARRPRSYWCDLLEQADTCVTPVLSVAEAARHPHNVARGTFVEANGLVQPAPVPRFADTPARIAGPPAFVGEHSVAVLADLGYSGPEIRRLTETGVLGVP